MLEDCRTLHAHRRRLGPAPSPAGAPLKSWGGPASFYIENHLLVSVAVDSVAQGEHTPDLWSGKLSAQATEQLKPVHPALSSDTRNLLHNAMAAGAGTLLAPYCSPGLRAPQRHPAVPCLLARESGWCADSLVSEAVSHLIVTSSFFLKLCLFILKYH